MLPRSHTVARSLMAAVAAVLAIASVATFATAIMMRCAPGFFSDERELDARYGATVRQTLATEQREQPGVLQICWTLAGKWIHLDFGQSRSWDVPVGSMIESRAGASVRLLAIALPLSWLIAFAASLPFSARAATWYDLATTILVSFALAIPAGALATVCIVTGHGGPVFVVTVLLAGRIYRFLHSMLQQAWSATHVTVARALGISSPRLLFRYVLPQIGPQLVPLFGMSIMTAVAALVPVEVLFDQPGLGKLAWQSSMNRDLPVLAVITMIFSGAVAFAGAISNGAQGADGGAA